MVTNESNKARLADEVAQRQPVDPSGYEFNFTTCKVNAEMIPKGAVDVPPGEGYEIGFEITNLSDTRQQYELRFVLTPTDGSEPWVYPRLDTAALDPGETYSELLEGHSSESFWNGFTCSVEVWPSIVAIVDRLSAED